MRLTVDPHWGFHARDPQGGLWQCYTTTTPAVKFPHYPLVTVTRWYRIAKATA